MSSYGEGRKEFAIIPVVVSLLSDSAPINPDKKTFFCNDKSPRLSEDICPGLFEDCGNSCVLKRFLQENK